MTDKSLLITIGKFIRHHRLEQNRSQSAVAKAAGISRSTLSLLERGENISLSSLLQILRILDLLHVMNTFEVQQEVSPVEYAKLQKTRRQRARDNNEDWTVNEDIGW